MFIYELFSISVHIFFNTFLDPLVETNDKSHKLWRKVKQKNYEK